MDDIGHRLAILPPDPKAEAKAGVAQTNWESTDDEVADTLRFKAGAYALAAHDLGEWGAWVEELADEYGQLRDLDRFFLYADHLRVQLYNLGGKALGDAISLENKERE